MARAGLANGVAEMGSIFNDDALHREGQGVQSGQRLPGHEDGDRLGPLAVQSAQQVLADKATGSGDEDALGLERSWHEVGAAL